jgi:AcrR family transcriptional regulator
VSHSRPTEGPPWARPEPAHRKARFTRDQIARVAIAIADNEGFESVSMRRVATELDAGTMSLYHYVRTKADLVALMDDAVMAEVLVPPEEMPAGWREALGAIARRTRGVLMRHPWVLSSLRDPPFGPNAMRHVEQFFAALGDTAVGGAERLELLALVNAYVFGNVLQTAESQRRTAAARDHPEAASALLEFGLRELGSGAYPQMAAMFAADGGEVRTEAMDEASLGHQFERGLQTLLDGVAIRVAGAR